MNRLLLVYGLASACLYSMLLPIWEGFDELYHFGYVQTLATSARFPEIGKTRISYELWNSLGDAPASHWIQPYFERPSTSFEQYFLLPEAERRARRQALERLDRSLQEQPSPRDNYEAKQAPLTYMLLAPIEWILAGRALTARVLLLRLALSITSLGLLWAGFLRLSQQLGLNGVSQAAALFVLFSTQMVYAATCHVANDALLAPWLLWFLCSLLERRAVQAGLLMGIGLLLKSSTLLMVPLLCAPLLWDRRNYKQAGVSVATLFVIAGPWYARNWILYHNLTAAPETSGIGPTQLIAAVWSMPWSKGMTETLHSALWTGNSSFTTFSASTLNVALLFFGVCGVLWIPRMRRSRGEALVGVAIALYSAGLVAITAAFFLTSQGTVIAPMPWYVEPLLAPVTLVCFLALSAQPFWRWATMAAVLFWTYLALATWLAKLIPLYGGFPAQQARPLQLWHWYVQQSALRNSILSTISPAPIWLIYLFLALVLVTLARLSIVLLSRLQKA